MKQLWKNLNTVCSFNNNKRKSECISKIMDEGREITDPYAISMFLNSYFSTVGERLLQQSTSTNKPKISPRQDTITLVHLLLKTLLKD